MSGTKGAWVAVVLLGAPAIVVWSLRALVGLTWLAELAIPWTPHAGVLALVAAAIAWPRQRWVAAALAVVGMLQVSVVGSRLGGRHPVADGAPTLSLAVLNVHADNRDVADVVDWLFTTNPDVVVLVELTPAFAQAAHTLHERWPFAAVAAKDGFWGTGIWSKQPLTDLGPVDGVRAWAVQLVDGPRIVAVHLMPPESARGVVARGEGVTALARYTARADVPTLVAGDLNLTPWSPHFRRLLAQGDLVDLGDGTGPAATWPSALGPLGIPIDHVLGTPGIGTVERVVGPDVGSDHRGLFTIVGY
ncbi:MAG: endonuclease/exonuclease/phosphatase family protein [Alphaproteobacteria bacterium]|nr:endonuclease/exonuclease/phosphatase family protein [Alphaproteobacteria bacterium]